MAPAASRATKPSPGSWTRSLATSPPPSPPAAACRPVCTTSPHRARAAGLTVTGRTLRAWQAGTRTPLRKNLAAIEQAYRTVRRENVAPYLLAHLNRDGHGTRVEVHPVNQSRVDRPRQRAVEFRTMNVRRWERIVGAWVAGADQELDDA